MDFEWWMAVVGLALLFDFYNGMNDAANSVATVIATRVLRPMQAVALAAVMNLVGPFVLGLAVAATVGSGIIEPSIITTAVIAGAVLGGTVTTALATWLGLPISVSHSLIGGLIGAGIAAGGIPAIQLPTRAETVPILELAIGGALVGALVFYLAAAFARGRNLSAPTAAGAVVCSTGAMIWGVWSGFIKMSGLTKTLVFIVYSPIIGFGAAFVLGTLILRFVRNAEPRNANRWFRRLQLVSASAYSLSHGTNDAQKTMGVITALLIANGVVQIGEAGDFPVPTWVIISAATAMGLGTLIGGFRVIRTLGHRLTHLEPHQGFTAETSSALVLFGMADLGVPVSTTHSITGAILGVGSTKSVRAVRWGVARHIILAWILTIPLSATVAFLVERAIRMVVPG